MRLKSELLDLSDTAWQRLRTRVEGLTDEEYLWEPAPYCWTVRAAGDGTWRADGSPLPPEPAPLTTIAWRLSHLIDLLSGERNATWLGVTPAAAPGREGAPGTAAEALERLDQAYALFRGHVDAADEAALPEPMGPIAGAYAEHTRAAFILHEVDELIHHGAEVGVLRDLYQATRPREPFVAACLGDDLQEVKSLLAADPGLRDAHPAMLGQAAAAGSWRVVRLLADAGFEVDPADGVPAIHSAAGAGELEVVRLLVERGADLSVRDPRFSETPLGWARYFRQDEVAGYLESVSAPAGPPA
ncbi:ankyrin repeat domain-containing protein [Actinomadura alba]|uniref:Ankyrin repeat domain-containing protein n=1 Tax=Actinomadura alba TaxID=406431 RepID=A0ABR7LUH7_9ACTN|nr:ankyrin repeat domain-containing protein [Actinomadura alba]MBC6468499.1 ankyrin repeat domain-containing protein [Actinomadura alba]